jgi:Cd2+/Zn2+-exporting ATPase
VEAIEELKKRYGKIAMVGDGINDAPALAAATIGASMGATGTNAALETADIALMKDDLSKLPYLKRLSRYTVRNIKENIFLALGIKAVFLMLAIPGLATLWMAVVADMGASLLVVFNGLRVLRFGND